MAQLNKDVRLEDAKDDEMKSGIRVGIRTRRSHGSGRTAACALVALLSHLLLHKNGMFMSPDGWYYFEIAYSLSECIGYRDLFGQFVTTWPPLFPVYLSPFIWLLGPVGFALVIASAAIVAAQAAAWCHVLQLAFFDASCDRPYRVRAWLFSLFVGLYVALNNQQLLADALMYALAPMYLLCLWAALSAREVRALGRAAIMGAIIGSCMLITANKATAFVAACGVCIAFQHINPRVKLIWIGSFTIVPLLVWMCVRVLMGQTSSHPVAVGGGKYSYSDYMLQAVNGVGRQLVSERMGVGAIVGVIAIAALLIFAVRGRVISKASMLSTYVLVSVSTTAILLNLTGLADELNGRLVVLVGLAGSAAAMSLLVTYGNKYLAACCITMLTLMQSYWTAVWWQNAMTVPAVSGGGFIRNEDRIARDYLAGPPTIRHGAAVVAPYRADWYYDLGVSPIGNR